MKIINFAILTILVTMSFSSHAYIRNPNGDITFSKNELRVSGLPVSCPSNEHGVCRRFAHSVLKRADWRHWYAVNYSCTGWESTSGYQIDDEGSIRGVNNSNTMDALTCNNQ